MVAGIFTAALRRIRFTARVLSSFLRDFTTLRNFFAARRAFLNFCFASRSPALARLADFLAASAFFCVAAIAAVNFFLAAERSAGVVILLVMTGKNLPLPAGRPGRNAAYVTF